MLALFIVGYLLGVSKAADPIQILNSHIAVTSYGYQYWTADKVNDGIVNIQGIADNCGCCAALLRPAWVQVTLDKTYLVEKILVLGRTDQDFTQFDNITLLLGRQDQSLQAAAFTWQNRSFAMTTLAPPREAYVVRVSGGRSTDSMTTSTYMTICEIILYRQADCLPGKYSANCSRDCHCLSGLCESVTGTCLTSLCKHGWRGLACNETCNSGTFGDNCSSICHCYENVTCHHINGTCPNNQCAAGWTRDNCSVACTPGFYGQNCSKDCHCDTCQNVNGSCVGSLRCHDGFRMENSFCTPVSPECHTDKYYITLVAVSSVFGVVVAAVIVLSVLIIRRKHPQFVGETRANRESSSHETYDDLSPNSTNPNFYDDLQMS
ncbi:hypothetical protein DPMN_155706 [Dreissena polymorpha]|uniref:Uncharacterized protein n=1 Tax=Dreissena polymorpha TaxID=45954 RepID=A0A9D4JA63_DREPO|nr:hypothetical protein DPMN_155706 [Dreissena polymorpha]